jgi:hypothetical protein
MLLVAVARFLGELEQLLFVLVLSDALRGSVVAPMPHP